jgi:hypothetical protein
VTAASAAIIRNSTSFLFSRKAKKLEVISEAPTIKISSSVIYHLPYKSGALDTHQIFNFSLIFASKAESIQYYIYLHSLGTLPSCSQKSDTNEKVCQHQTCQHNTAKGKLRQGKKRFTASAPEVKVILFPQFFFIQCPPCEPSSQ